MEIIIKNILFVFVLPFFVGGIIRFVLRKFSKAWLITIITAVASIVAYVVSVNPPVRGSELYGIITIQCVGFMIGSLIVGLVIRQRNKIQHS